MVAEQATSHSDNGSDPESLRWAAFETDSEAESEESDNDSESVCWIASETDSEAESEEPQNEHWGNGFSDTGSEADERQTALLAKERAHGAGATPRRRG